MSTIILIDSLDYSKDEGKVRLAEKRKLAAKRNKVKDTIRDMVSEKGLLGKQLLPERALAQELGIARRTLQLALAELQKENFIERKQGRGTFVVDPALRPEIRSNARIALITKNFQPNLTRWSYYNEFAKGALAYVPKIGATCTVLDLNSPADLANFRNKRFMKSFNAFMTVGEYPLDFMAYLLALKSGPIVVLDHAVRDLPIICVVDASYEGIRATARHLVGMGHRRIGFIDTYDRELVNPMKFAGYRTAMQKGVATFDPELVINPEKLGLYPAFASGNKSADINSQGAVKKFVDMAIDRLLGLKDPATAILSYDDIRGELSLHSLQERGIRVGKDVAVAGFGDASFRAGTCDWMTSCRVYPRKMVREGIDAALEGIKPGECRNIIVPTRVYVRRSSKPDAVAKAAAE
jgi:DNA-binding LacI/PurR family transcriptional regulator